jgi:hypothetical protein
MRMESDSSNVHFRVVFAQSRKNHPENPFLDR